MRFAVALLGLVLGGCAANFDETTLVKVASPSAVKVGATTPRGGVWLLEADEVGKKEVPNSKPPLTEGGYFATVKRDADGTVDLGCPSCKRATDAHPVPSAYRPIELSGELDKTITWQPDRLDMRYSHIASFPCYRNPRHDCPREAIGLWLETPRENVIEIRHLKHVELEHGERLGAKLAVGAGIGADAVGLAILGAFTFDKDARRLPTLGVSSAFLGIGTFFLVTGIRGLLAEDSDEVVYRRKEN